MPFSLLKAEDLIFFKAWRRRRPHACYFYYVYNYAKIDIATKTILISMSTVKLDTAHMHLGLVAMGKSHSVVEVCLLHVNGEWKLMSIL